MPNRIEKRAEPCPILPFVLKKEETKLFQTY